MLVLSRKPGELIQIGNNVEVTVLKVRGQRVLVGLTAPAEVPIRRQEISRASRAEIKRHYPHPRLAHRK